MTASNQQIVDALALLFEIVLFFLVWWILQEPAGSRELSKLEQVET